MRSARVVVRSRVRQGWARVRRAAVPVLLASVAAGVAFAVAHYLLGHEAPFFAPVSAWIALGFSADRQLRRVAELAIGVAVGVGLADLLVGLIGTGSMQIALVLALAALAARFLDRGSLLATQAGVQAIVIVALPAADSGGPIGRWTDALIGGLVALVAAALWPQDPRRWSRSLAEEGVTEVTDVLRLLARGMSTGEPQDVDEALIRGRASQAVLDQWRDVARNARQMVQVSPAHRRHRAELGELETSAVMLDRVMRSARVLARRSRVVVRDGHDVAALASLVEAVARATEQLAGELADGVEPVRTRERIMDVATRSDPWAVSPDDWHVQSLVLLLRSLVVDLGEAAGMEGDEVRACLPHL
ncbi:aromatic acid exporter family protein [Actinotalea sp. K2]|uniref:FUSC family protein n=1 Tax=Actinotalea sp. K2 TaxID=2939438 RepID=UPI002016BF9E|nr:FUSC family protein [Actinotalea sp. K2]MCL3859536.1 FUSC family protein [Actinotalea sp. K2]